MVGHHKGRENLVILEGIRRSGKSFTIDVLKKRSPNLVHYKDAGMRIIDHEIVDPDQYAIGRDFAYAQFLPKLRWDSYFIEHIGPRMYMDSAGVSDSVSRS